jgi:hypothetical protein
MVKQARIFPAQSPGRRKYNSRLPLHHNRRHSHKLLPHTGKELYISMQEKPEEYFYTIILSHFKRQNDSGRNSMYTK